MGFHLTACPILYQFTYSIAARRSKEQCNLTINSGLNFSINVMELSSKRSHIAGLRCFRTTFLENSKLQANVRISNISSRISFRFCTSSPTRIQTTRPLRWQLSVEPSNPALLCPVPPLRSRQHPQSKSKTKLKYFKLFD